MRLSTSLRQTGGPTGNRTPTLPVQAGCAAVITISPYAPVRWPVRALLKAVCGHIREDGSHEGTRTLFNRSALQAATTPWYVAMAPRILYGSPCRPAYCLGTPAEAKRRQEGKWLARRDSNPRWRYEPRGLKRPDPSSLGARASEEMVQTREVESLHQVWHTRRLTVEPHVCIDGAP